MVSIASKSTGGTLSSSEFNQVPDELENFVSASGQTPAAGTLDQVAKGVINTTANGDYYTDGGAADAYVLSAISPNKSPTLYTVGMRVRFRPANTNTGASVINVATLGSKNIKLQDGSSDPVAGDISDSKDIMLRYDGTSFLLEQKAALPRNYIDGLILSNNVTDSEHDIDVAIGECKDSTNIQDLTLSSVFTKQIDVDWAEGTGDGGFPSSLTLSADTWYHYFIIAKTSGQVDFGFDTSLSAANLLADATDYTTYRRIGSVLTDASSNIIAFTQYDDEFEWVDQVQDEAINNPGTSGVLKALSVPLGIITNALFAITIFDNSDDIGTNYYLVTSPQQTDSVPSVSNFTFADDSTAGDNLYETVSTSRRTDTSSQIRYRISFSDTDITVYISTTGWIDKRGKQ